MKLCGNCGVTKGVGDFGPNRTRKDGLQSWCKSCRIASNTRRQTERLRQDPVYRAKRAVQSRGTPEKRRKERAEGRIARRVVGSKAWGRSQLQQAVYYGRVDKPEVCEGCQQRTPKHLLHGHHWHEDYANRPLEVQWLCSLCHGASHKAGVAA